MGTPSGSVSRELELQILNCGLPRHLKRTLHVMYRCGNWERGDSIRVANATLARRLSINKRNVQFHIGALIAMGILKVAGLHAPTRRRDGRVVLSGRRGGRRP